MATAKDGLRVLGELIRNRRIASDLTQSQLGKRAGIVGKYVSEIERGTRDVPFSTLHAIVEDGLGRHLDVRFGETRSARPAPPARGLPRSVELVARAIAELPPERRSAVLMIVRSVLRLARP
jgi:transcriptional regulator with XRE-family HTH domain